MCVNSSGEESRWASPQQLLNLDGLWFEFEYLSHDRFLKRRTQLNRCGLIIHTGWYKLTDNEQRIIEATSPVLMHS